MEPAISAKTKRYKAPSKPYRIWVAEWRAFSATNPVCGCGCGRKLEPSLESYRVAIQKFGRPPQYLMGHNRKGDIGVGGRSASDNRPLRVGNCTLLPDYTREPECLVCTGYIACLGAVAINRSLWDGWKIGEQEVINKCRK